MSEKAAAVSRARSAVIPRRPTMNDETAALLELRGVIGQQLLTLKDLERFTGRKIATWRRDIRLGRIAIVRIGRQVRVPVEAFEELLRRGYCAARPEA
jgi:hypothetical protein